MSSATQPVTSVHAKPFWEGVEIGELRLPWCQACGEPHFPPRPFCPHCWADEPEWRPASGRGTLYSYTTVLANPPSAFADLVPFVIGIVRLDEGVQMMSHVEGASTGIVCDAPVQVTWRRIRDRRLPAFEIIDSGSD